MLMPAKFEAVQHYWVMPVEAPHIEAYKPQPVKPAPVVKIKREVVKEIPKPVEVPEIVAPKPKVYTTVFYRSGDKDRRRKRLKSRPMCKSRKHSLIRLLHFRWAAPRP